MEQRVLIYFFFVLFNIDKYYMLWGIKKDDDTAILYFGYMMLGLFIIAILI
tara:strand:+ start:336 stop:488 length:153 start_codon:yes stop_codon:yes gene_type:complete